jgi:hypothetical protein
MDAFIPWKVLALQYRLAHGIVTCCSTKSGEFVDQISDNRLLVKDSAA